MLKYKILPTIKVVLVVNTGKSDPAEVVKFMAHLQQHAPEVLTYDSLTDVRQLENHFTFNEADLVVRDLAKIEDSQPRKNALLCQQGVLFGVGRMFQQISDGRIAIVTQPFTRVAEAADWLACDGRVLEEQLVSADGWIAI